MNFVTPTHTNKDSPFLFLHLQTDPGDSSACILFINKLVWKSFTAKNGALNVKAKKTYSCRKPWRCGSGSVQIRIVWLDNGSFLLTLLDSDPDSTKLGCCFMFRVKSASRFVFSFTHARNPRVINCGIRTNSKPQTHCLSRKNENQTASVHTVKHLLLQF